MLRHPAEPPATARAILPQVHRLVLRQPPAQRDTAMQTRARKRERALLPRRPADHAALLLRAQGRRRVRVVTSSTAARRIASCSSRSRSSSPTGSPRTSAAASRSTQGSHTGAACGWRLRRARYRGSLIAWHGDGRPHPDLERPGLGAQLYSVGHSVTSRGRRGPTRSRLAREQRKRLGVTDVNPCCEAHQLPQAQIL